MPKARILIGGDVCPVNRYVPLFQEGNPARILGPLAPIVSASDLFLANLECPLIAHPTPILKTGPALGVPVQCANGLQKMGLHAVGLANNHIMDHGPEGLGSTLSACREQGLTVFGAGASLPEAQQIRVMEVNGLRIGLLAMAEREWSIAGQHRPGANPIDLAMAARAIQRDKARFDHLIVLLHAGAEGYELPSPSLMHTARFLVEEGANLVVSQHSHCVGSFEFYLGQLIVYGQGNFIFDYPSHGTKGNQGVLIAMDIAEDGKRSYNFHPFRQDTDKAGIADVPDADAFLEAFRDRSEVLAEEACVAQKWRAFCEAEKAHYLFSTLGFGRMRQRLARLPWFDPSNDPVYQKRLLGMLQNETHLELLRTALRTSLGLD